MKAPDKIFLQWHGDGDPQDGSPVAESEVTWCRERVFTGDIEYLRQQPGRDCASFCHSDEPCSITATGRCDVIQELKTDIRDTSWQLEVTSGMLARERLYADDLVEILERCEMWLSTVKEGAAMQMECRRVIERKPERPQTAPPNPPAPSKR